jgi:hypothetical protein
MAEVELSRGNAITLAYTAGENSENGSSLCKASTSRVPRSKPEDRDQLQALGSNPPCYIDLISRAR